MSDAYKDIGYGTIAIGRGNRPAVLVVDWQAGFSDPSFPLGGNARLHRARDETAALLKTARACGVPVAAAYLAYGGEAEMPFWKIPALQDFIHGHPSTRIDPTIDDPSNFTFFKNAPSMFFQTPLMTFLTRHQVDTVIVTGCTTSGCVRATVVDGFSYGLKVLIAEDCCGDPAEEAQRQTLLDCGRRYADVTNRTELEIWFPTLPGAAGR